MATATKKPRWHSIDCPRAGFHYNPDRPDDHEIRPDVEQRISRESCRGCKEMREERASR